MIKNLVFDFGGVIVSLCHDVAVKAFEKLGVADAKHILDKYHQTGIFLELEEGTISEEEYRKKLSNICGRPLTFEEVQKAWLAFIHNVNLEQLEYLKTLREKYHLYILSNTNPYVTAWACSTQFTPDKKSLNDYFDKLYLSYEIGFTKPDERIFQYLIKDANILPEETLFVDDSQANIAMGHHIGMHTLLAEDGISWKKNLEKRLNE